MCYSNGNSYPFVFKFPSSFAFAVHLTACILSGIIVLTTVSLNSLTVLTFWRTPRLRENASLYLVMILSLVDAGIGTFCHPFITISLIHDLMNLQACWIYHVQSKSLRPTTVLSLSIVAAISVERYFGVVHPLIHRAKITKVKLSLLVLFIWSSCAIVSLPAHFNDNSLKILASISIVCLMLITACCYTKIAHTVIYSKIRRTIPINAHSSTDGQNGAREKKNRKEILHFLIEIKMAKSCFLIVLCYLMCYSPIIVVSAILRNKLSPLTQFYTRTWCLLFIMLNSSLNSIIFFWRNAHLRNETKNVLKNIKLKCFSS